MWLTEKIRNIHIEDETSWKNKIFITLDIDWAIDEILEYVLDIIENYQIKTTLFCTHKTTLIQRMRGNENLELGIHPNFNFLLTGDFRYGGNYCEVIDYYKQIIPDALSVRSHSLTYNTYFGDLFCRHGFEYECNYYIPYNAGISLRPFYHWDKKLKRIPHLWEDDIQLMDNSKYVLTEVLKTEGLKVLDFHPIHIFLNTEKFSRYEHAKKYYNNYKELCNLINNDHYGIRDFFIELVGQCR